jgi:hypothetical protein
MKRVPVNAKGHELPRMREHILKGVRTADVANYVNSVLACLACSLVIAANWPQLLTLASRTLTNIWFSWSRVKFTIQKKKMLINLYDVRDVSILIQLEDSFSVLSQWSRPWLGTFKSLSQLSRQCGIPNISLSYRPPRPVTGIVFFLDWKIQLLKIRIDTNFKKITSFVFIVTHRSYSKT